MKMLLKRITQAAPIFASILLASTLSAQTAEINVDSSAWGRGGVNIWEVMPSVKAEPMLGKVVAAVGTNQISDTNATSDWDFTHLAGTEPMLEKMIAAVGTNQISDTNATVDWDFMRLAGTEPMLGKMIAAVGTNQISYTNAFSDWDFTRLAGTEPMLGYTMANLEVSRAWSTANLLSEQH